MTETDLADPSNPTVGTEFVGTSIASDCPAQLIAPVQAALSGNPHTLYFDDQYRGYMRCALTHDQWRAEFRAVPTILADAVEAFTLASFVVLDGQPGATPYSFTSPIQANARPTTRSRAS